MRCSCCGGGDGDGNNASPAVIGLGLALGASFALLLAAGIRFGTWLPMINLGAIVLVPMAVILTDTLGGGSIYSAAYDEGKAAWANFGSCLFGTILVSLIGLPLVLLHTGAIMNEGFGLWMASTAITFVSAVWYWVMRQRAKIEG